MERININFPRWIEGLDDDHWLKQQLYSEIKENLGEIRRIKEFRRGIGGMSTSEIITNVELKEIQLGTGSMLVNINMKEELFYKVLTEISGMTINNEGDMFSIISELAVVKKEYDKMAYAIHEVKEKGYGIVTPTMEELELEEPEMLKQGTRFGIKLKAKAPSIHMIRADIETEVAPIVGSEKQSEELVNAQGKIQETLERIINEGSGGLICIIL